MLDPGRVVQETLTKDKFSGLIIANYRAVCAAGWTDDYADVVVEMHIMAVLLGALDSRGSGRSLQC